MRPRRKTAFLSACFSALLLAVPVHADESATQNVVLSPLELTAPKNTINHITQTDMERKTVVNVWDALNGVPGVKMIRSSRRGESFIGIRGSNNYQVGLYLDDIPITTSYRGELDIATLMTPGLGSIEVSKGFNSPLLIGSSLAGAVNMRTAKPEKPFEMTARYINRFDRFMDDMGRTASVNIGTRQDKFYLKANLVWDYQRFFTLPDSYSAGPLQPEGRRENSDHENVLGHIIAGWTPTEDIDIMLGYLHQTSHMGQPYDAARYREKVEKGKAKQLYPKEGFSYWSNYETNRLYANADFQFTNKAHLKAVAYYDQHMDTLQDYVDSHMTKLSGPEGSYVDESIGGQLKFDYTFNAANRLDLSAGYRVLLHKAYTDYDSSASWNFKKNRYDKRKDWEHGERLDGDIRESYLDLGAEYTFKPTDKLTFVLGGSLSHMTPVSYEDRDSDTGLMRSYRDEQDSPKTLFNYQLGVFYDITDKHEVFATFAKKSRFPTMFERYRTLPNGKAASADLEAEHAWHYELGYRGVIDDWLKLNASVYYSDISDKITSYNVKPDPGMEKRRGWRGFKNLERVAISGFELNAEALVNEYFSAGATFNYMHAENCTNDKKLTNMPEVTGSAYAIISPLEGLSIIPAINYSSSFYWQEDEHDVPYRQSPGFITADLKMVYDINEHFSVEAGVKNIFDEEYAYSAYYPEPGRNYFVGVTATF